MKKLLRFMVLFMLCGLFLGLAGFLALALYYHSHFPVNIWINGVYCTGKTVEQVNEELAGSREESVIWVEDAYRERWEIDMGDAGIRPDYTSVLKSCLNQNVFGFWLNNLRNPTVYEVEANRYLVDEEKLRECFDGLPFVAREQERPKGASVRYSPEGYVFQDGNTQRLNMEMAFSYLRDCISKGQTEVRLWEGECYENIPDSETDAYQREIWNQVCDFTERGAGIVYDMGAEQIPLTPDVTSRFLEAENGVLSLDGQGNIMVSRDGIREWLEQLASEYDTCGTDKEFAATRGETVTVKYVTYGTELDVDAEEAYLLEALRTGEAGPHVPAYTQQGYVRGLDDIGSTYVEVDLTEQKLYYYVDGEIALETSVVTGNLARRMGTPEGINFVYNKQRNRTLRGPGYSSFVRYWMPVKGGIGLHDASWRSKFGGEIYKTNGSHGCINMATDIAAQLYDMVEIGTPVIMFY